MAALYDMFILSIPGETVDASIEVPGTFPLSVMAGQNYHIGFTYRKGSPAATDLFEAIWTASDNGSVPTTNISPQAPDQTGSAGQLQNGSVTGTVPDRQPLVENTTIVYTCSLSIIQPDG